MTIKQLFPHLSSEHRMLIGRRFVTSFRNVYKSRPLTIEEDGQKVCDYPAEFILTRLQRIKRKFKKAYPEANVDQPKRKRTRIQGTKVSY